MKVAAVLSLVSLAVASVIEKRECAGNNCNRAITGTRDGLPPVSLRSADCASFLKTTVTPAATTVTVTVEAEPSLVAKRDAVLEIRQATVVPSVLPAYATQCSGAPAYSSACSCFGITATVTTAPTPTVTVTSTIDYCEDL